MTNQHFSFIWQTIKNNTSLKTIIISLVFLLFIFSSTYQLGSVPGLVGDEGDEGQNIVELINKEKPPLMGERSYIGAWVDYARMPIVFSLGYNALSLRLFTLIASILFFSLGYFILTRLFGEIAGIIGIVTVCFSPTYFTQQRLAWAITLLPLFIVLTIYLYLQKNKWVPLLVGVAAGLGANTHILFVATIAGLVAAGIPLIFYSLVNNFSITRLTKLGTSILLAAIGFWAAFGIQYTNLALYKNDQGNIEKNSRTFTTRLAELPILAPKFISGSVYISSYTASEFGKVFDVTVTSILVAIIVSGILFSKKRWLLLLWVLGFAVHTLVLTYMIEYYALRYFIIDSLFFWLLCGVVIGSYFDRGAARKVGYVFAISLAVILTIFNFKNVVAQFDSTGGSTDNFNIINSRYESAAALVNLKPLLACIADKNNVFSNNIHIRNRLIFLANSNKNIRLATQKKDVRWLIRYHTPDDKNPPATFCSNLTHFAVEPVYDSRQVEWPDNQ